MDWGTRPALLIIDVCKAYWEPSSPLFLGTPAANPAGAAVPAAIRRLLSTARAAGIPVFHSQVEYASPTMADAGLFWRKSKVLDCWQKGDPRGLAQEVDGIEVGEGEGVVVKKYASAFFGTCEFAIFFPLAWQGDDVVGDCARHIGVWRGWLTLGSAAAALQAWPGISTSLASTLSSSAAYQLRVSSHCTTHLPSSGCALCYHPTLSPSLTVPPPLSASPLAPPRLRAGVHARRDAERVPADGRRHRVRGPVGRDPEQQLVRPQRQVRRRRVRAGRAGKDERAGRVAETVAAREGLQSNTGDEQVSLRAKRVLKRVSFAEVGQLDHSGITRAAWVRSNRNQPECPLQNRTETPNSLIPTQIWYHSRDTRNSFEQTDPRAGSSRGVSQ